MIYLIYSEFHQRRDASDDAIAHIETPLGCCGAAGLTHLRLSEDMTPALSEEVLTYFESLKTRHRGLIVIPVKRAAAYDNEAIEQYSKLWLEPAVHLGWRELGGTWVNPNTKRTLQTYYKDFK